MYIANSKELIASARGIKLLPLDRRDLAIKLAAYILQASREVETSSEKKNRQELARMMDDPAGKIFTMTLTDTCFRTHNNTRIANQVQYLIKRYGVPKYLSWFKRLQLSLFKVLGNYFAPITVPLMKKALHQDCSRFILPGEPQPLSKAIKKIEAKNIRVNLNHLGEAILGEDEAAHRLQIYLDDLKKPEVEYISVKISTIYSQINLIAWDKTLSILSDRLKTLLREAKKNQYVKPNGESVPKFVNLDMEEYRDLHCTVELFKHVLDDPEFIDHSAGIVLQSYLPDSFLIQQDLTVWAMQRREIGGAPIKIRLVKGANLAMEKVEASLQNWPQAPYATKTEVDANFKRMMQYAFKKHHARAAHIGIGSHNLFDIAYGLILRSEYEVDAEVTFEMLDGMAESLRKVIQELSGQMLLYCPATNKSEFQNAVAYLVRRLDENSGEDNFLSKSFKLTVDSPEWLNQVEQFSQACEQAHAVSVAPKRRQNRFITPSATKQTEFHNEADTDWALHQNTLWADMILNTWARKKDVSIPAVIDGTCYYPGQSTTVAEGYNPSNPSQSLYKYALIENALIDKALDTAVKEQKSWEKSTVQHRSSLLRNVAQHLKVARADLMGVMLADTGKTLTESDGEISEAIDFAEYYSRNLLEIATLPDIEWKAKGPVLVAPPWNFPCSIPTGGILAAIAAGNSVIFKPAPESVWVGWVLVQILWKAGVSPQVLQFINCSDEPYGTHLIQDPRLSLVVLTGATATAKHFLKLRPDLDLIAETGGKNAIIVSNLADRDQAVKDIVQSAFGHAGQKCSACSLLICHDEVYNDPQFRQQLRDAAASKQVGTPWDPATRISPLIRPAGATLLKGLTTLDAGEEWLLQPKQDPNNPNIWTPGIKLGVKPNSFTHQEELFGPVLGVMRAKNLQEAIILANQTRYGLTSGLQSLDLREQKEWAAKIEAGNLYINRGITGAIVQRQPFGGYKDSSFSPGAKAGGPNYLMQFMHAVPKKTLNPDTLKNYTHYWKNYFSKPHDPSQVLGEHNILRYLPRKNLHLRLQPNDNPAHIELCKTTAALVGTDLTISDASTETDTDFLARLIQCKAKRIRFLSPPSPALRKSLADHAIYVTIAPLSPNGRIELLHYLEEQSLTISYHRYGNLGENT